jgi:gas vesicle protein
MKKIFVILISMLFVISLFFAVVGCKKSEETANPQNETVTKVKEAATDVKDATKEAASDVKDAAKETADDVKDAVD